MTREPVAILAARRTPIGKYLGSFSNVSAVELGVVAAKAALESAGVAPAAIDQVIFGHARQAGNGPNPARQVGYRAGVPQEKPAFTVNQACASGLQAILLGASAIRLGDASLVLVGGMENMTRVPYLLDGARQGYRLGHAEVIDGMYRDGFLCPISDMVMGETAERLATEYEIGREEQDAYALESQMRAAKAIASGRFREEIAPVPVPGRKGETTRIDADEHPRGDASMEKLAKLPPVFAKDGTVSAGNSSGITDGAAALVLASAAKVKELSAHPLAWVEEHAVVGVDPHIMGIGPVPAVRKLLSESKSRLDDFDLVELNEAFAAQVLAVDRDLRFDRERLNVNGGAIALGHPIGCSGARIVVTLVHEMAKRQAERGLATLCVSGGLGVAASFRGSSSS